MQLFFALLSGLLISAGIAISKMIDPAKVLGFLDITGNWDPSLALVMVAALVVYTLGFRLLLKRGSPLLRADFSLPAKQQLEPSLLLGAAVFGVGWGLAGYCPGPAIAALPAASSGTAGFVIMMILGWFIAGKVPIRNRQQKS
ncbi:MULTISPECIES: DUF6691 family protein [unclassified Arsukibacterium]|uniref:DUF6691 family protein n=1 Tax=unclassified Arsukibacterium TaxID=2635278 RepID=UPI000C907127|nr:MULTISPECIES: DUF6691 family protein [unclassified Arsukibacterium]MAA94286.1 hypothetical protein [Rheinheimera sp.]HAW93872.1 hypothetical protein [Candidatus Azambacteria bacterium]|tara:strand:+ start:5152 stop:5580 length:429 start_codon:yes stop_codon:yes gene_type:complete